MVLLPAKLEIVPPATVTSEAVKVVEASLSVKVKVAESPVIRFVLFALKEIVGTTVSTEKVTELFASEPSALAFPMALVKTPVATLTTPFAVLLAAGVKVAM